MSDTVRVELPYPPSANRYYRTWRGRMLLSAEGREYKAAVAAVLLARGVRPLPGRIAVDVILHAPDRRRRDIDNANKAVLDSLKGPLGLFADDSQIDDLRTRRGAVRPGAGAALVTARVIEGEG